MTNPNKLIKNLSMAGSALIQSLAIMLLTIGAIKFYLHEGWPNYIVVGPGLIGLELMARLACKTRFRKNNTISQ